MKTLERYLERLTISQLRNVMRHIILLIEASLIPGIMQDPLVIKFIEIDKLLFEAINRKPKSGLGHIVQNLDKERCKKRTQLRQGALSLANPQTEKGVAALAILAIINSCGSFRGLRYGEKTELLSKMIEELSGESAQQKIDMTGLNEQFEALCNANTAFVNMVYEQRDADSALRQTMSGGKIKPLAIETMQDLMKLLYARRKYPLWDDLYADVFEVTNSAQISLKLSRKRKKKNDADSSDQSTVGSEQSSREQGA